MSFFFHHSSSQGKLGSIIGKNAASTNIQDLFQQQLVVCESRAMARWLSMEFAKQSGICANTQFPFPDMFMWDILGRVFPEIFKDEISPYRPENMKWVLKRLILEKINTKEFASIKFYLGGESINNSNQNLKLIQLCEKRIG